MKKNIKHTALIICAFFCMGAAFAQEALKSIEEEYYDFLSLQGITERPTLGYRTLSDSVWRIEETDEDALNGDEFVKITPNHPWQNLNLGTTRMIWENPSPTDNPYIKGVKQGIFLKIYGPEWFNSFNTATPYGQNDGALWQGKGYNTSLTGGARIEGYGLEVTVKPMVTFSQNLEFDYLPGVYGDPHSYFWRGNIDLVQQFGDDPYWQFDWGDTEVRYTWHTITIGFGTQSLWLGPAWLNPMLGSNNSGTYPKFDIGMRRQRVVIPGLGWYLGDVEGRVWLGQLTESKYFDNDPKNDKTRINGFNFSFSPAFIPNLSFGVTKVTLSKWDYFNLKYLNPFYSTNGYKTEADEDQKASIYIYYISTKAALELYGEIGMDDYFQEGFFQGFVRYPFDTLIWTLGLKKAINFSKKNNFYGELILELSDMELPRNRLSSKQTYNFNGHHFITHGYTNKGQVLGTDLANGGNSQLLQFNFYYPKGVAGIITQRSNPTNTYSYTSLENHNETYKGYLLIGLNNNYFIFDGFSVSAAINYIYIKNNLYHTIDSEGNISGTDFLNNFSIHIGVKYRI